jgi:hypothetical protein
MVAFHCFGREFLIDVLFKELRKERREGRRWLPGNAESAFSISGR